MDILSKRLRELRTEKGITQIEVGKDLEISSQSYSTYETGREPRFDVLIKLAKYFNVSTDYLLGLDDIRNIAELRKIDGLREELNTLLDGLDKSFSDDITHTLGLILETMDSISCDSTLQEYYSWTVGDVVNWMSEAIIIASNYRNKYHENVNEREIIKDTRKLLNAHNDCIVKINKYFNYTGRGLYEKPKAPLPYKEIEDEE